jgi:hypothetical protein
MEGAARPDRHAAPLQVLHLNCPTVIRLIGSSNEQGSFHAVALIAAFVFTAAIQGLALIIYLA